MDSISGRLFSGMGVAGDYLDLQPYQEKISSITGFRPFPGTLNLRVDKDRLEEVVDSLESLRIDGFEYKGENYSGLDVYMVEVDGLKGAYIDLDVTDYGDEVIEVIAPDKLRQRLDIRDGEEVNVDFL